MLGQELADVRARHAAAVQDRNALGVMAPTEVGGESRADRFGHCGRVGARCGSAGTDRPYGFVGDHEAGVEERLNVLARQGAAELSRHDLDGAAGLTLGQHLADAQDRAQTGTDGASQLLADQLVAFELIAASLGVAEDDPRGQSGQHGCGDLACVGAALLVMDVLGADGDVLAGQCVTDGGQANEGRADDSNHARLLGPGGDCRGQLSSICGGGVHLPVGGNDQGSHGRK